MTWAGWVDGNLFWEVVGTNIVSDNHGGCNHWLAITAVDVIA
jgi:hypothetical protein